MGMGENKNNNDAWKWKTNSNDSWKLAILSDSLNIQQWVRKKTADTSVQNKQWKFCLYQGKILIVATALEKLWNISKTTTAKRWNEGLISFKQAWNDQLKLFSLEIGIFPQQKIYNKFFENCKQQQQALNVLTTFHWIWKKNID